MPFEALVPFDCFRKAQCLKQSLQPDIHVCNYSNGICSLQLLWRYVLICVVNLWYLHHKIPPFINEYLREKEAFVLVMPDVECIALKYGIPSGNVMRIQSGCVVIYQWSFIYMWWVFVSVSFIQNELLSVYFYRVRDYSSTRGLLLLPVHKC
jgi:hypothetical protein